MQKTLGSFNAERDGKAPGVNSLFDRIIFHAGLKNDASLCRLLDVTPPVVSKLRHGRIGLSGEMIIRIHEKLEWPIKDIKAAIAPVASDSENQSQAKAA